MLISRFCDSGTEIIMDPLSITSGVIAVLQLASSVVSYLSAVKDASDDRQRLIAEIGSITGLLFLLKEQSSDSSDALNSLCVTNGPLDMFKGALSELATKLRPADGGLKRAGKSLLWPFQKSEVNNLLHRIERLKGMFILALQKDNTQLTRRMVEDFGGVRESLTYVHDTMKQIESDTIGKHQPHLHLEAMGSIFALFRNPTRIAMRFCYSLKL